MDLERHPDDEQEQAAPTLPTWRPCASCGRPMARAVTAQGNDMPIDVDPAPTGKGNVEVEVDLFGLARARVVAPGQGQYVAHFYTCPNAQHHRKRTRR